MQITFHGAAGGVTGSKHLLEINNYKILLDCGLFQGRRSESREKNMNLPFEAKSIHAVVLSHAHLDHCGLLPLLIRNGYKGKIYATPATKDVAKHMLEDAAGIMESDYAYLKKKKDSKSDKMASPLYTRSDIPITLRRFVTVDYARNSGGWNEILPGIRLKLYDAGHILGSAVVVLEWGEGAKKQRLAFTGDLGRKNSPLLYDPVVPKEKIDIMISESTYGKKSYSSLEEAKDKIVELVRYICDNKSKMIVPAFSLGRTQEFVYILHQLTDEKRIPRIPIYVDSPLAGRVTQVFRKYRHDYDMESRLDFPRPGDVPLAFRNLRYTKAREESIELNTKEGPFIVISASGMAEGGRVLHHLKNSIHSVKNVILFTGYQAVNTLGRRILRGESNVRIYGRRYQVNARVEVVNSLSAHADLDELADYILKTKGVAEVFLVHGEAESSRSLKRELNKKAKKISVHIPQQGQKFDL